ncbi:MAG TPA: glycosyltransferase family 39 protein [Ktedonobacteraceae bacterium]|nr:glycosyltransferase family 39 protein [Ktedonobacteraceae bacterium]
MGLLAYTTRSVRDVPSALAGHRATFSSLLRSWEFYLLLLVTLFLRLYHIDLTEFDGDQATIFYMAREAINQGMLVATSNGASIGIINPPAVVYLLMITAAFSPNPLWAAVLTALMASLAVVLTYVFVRRYFGRVAATITALTYALAYRSVFYARFIWNQNFLHLFVILFFFALFWGVVERRRGWLFPAMFLLGLMIQLHATAVLLAAPLLVAVLLAPGTIRWRDLLLGLLSLLLLYLPYLLWEFSVQFYDLNLLLTPSKHLPVVDNEALLFYQSYLNPFQEPLNRHSVLYQVAPWFGWLTGTLTVLVIAGALLALVQVVWPGHEKNTHQSRSDAPVSSWWRRPFVWWQRLRAAPLRSGLLVLLIWQAVPLAYLSRHSLPIYMHYFIIFMPGQFLLLGFFLASAIAWLGNWGSAGRAGRYLLYAFSTLTVVTLLLGSVAQLIDLSLGNYNDHALSRPYYQDLSTVEDAMAAADKLAMQRHLHHVYIATDTNQMIFQALAYRMHTPMTLFDKRYCMLLPDPASGPAVMLVSPYNSITDDLLAHYTQSTLVRTLARPGGDPYLLYVVRSLPATVAASPAHSFSDNLRLLDTTAQTAYLGNTRRMVMRWQLLRSAAPSSRVSYDYRFAVSAPALDRTVAEGSCSLTSLQTGDQLITALPQSAADVQALQLSLSATYQETHPFYLSYGPLKFETIKDDYTPLSRLVTDDGKKRMLLS